MGQKVKRYTPEFRRQMVDLHRAGRTFAELAASLKQVGLQLDLAAANAHIGPWLERVANQRLHATTHAVPAERLALERAQLQPLPHHSSVVDSGTRVRSRVALPIESLQHPLSVYESLVGVPV